MRIRGAVLNAMGAQPPYDVSRPLAIDAVELKPPGRGEVLVEMAAAGLCHSDLSVIDGTARARRRWCWGTRRRGSSRSWARA